jgi:hypothetical protein
MSFPVVPVRCCMLAVAIERDLGSPSNLHTGTAVAEFHDKRDLPDRALAACSTARWLQIAQGGSEVAARQDETGRDAGSPVPSISLQIPEGPRQAETAARFS